MTQFLRKTIAVGATPDLEPIQSLSVQGGQRIYPTINLSVRETAGVACQIATRGRFGSRIDDVAANGVLFVAGIEDVSDLQITGQGATVVVDASYPESIDPKYLVAITEPSTVTVSNRVSVSIDAQTQLLTVNPTDTTGAGLETTYLGVGNAPATGVWHVEITPSVNAAYPAINGNPVAPDGAPTEASMSNSATYKYSYPVKKGSAYAVTGGTVVDGTVGV